MTTGPDLSPHERMLGIVAGFWLSRAVHAAARLRLADHIADGKPLPPAALAERSSTHAPSLHRLLRALASAGVFREDEAGRFHQTPLSATLRSDTADTVEAFVLLELGDAHHRAWGRFLHSLHTGEAAFDTSESVPIWEYFRRHEDARQLLGRSMAQMTAALIPGFLAYHPFPSGATVVDVGGGEGRFLTGLLAARQDIRGVLFELPDVAAAARRALAAAGLESRCEAVGGDFFQAVPEGGDVYLMKWVLHDWDDAHCRRILASVRRAMGPGAVLLVLDAVITPGNESQIGKLVDLDMLVLAGGRECTEEEFRLLLADAGFAVRRVVPGPVVAVVDAVPAAGHPREGDHG
ncbi:methyltransferase [Streptomyces sp. NPDC094448]|uniref:methyltransferase n=1 Tax=Streptomyces sp. NPDC094448 TaxID=3366063 RepID=UPI0038096562